MTAIVQSLFGRAARTSGFHLVVLIGVVGLLASLNLIQQGVDIAPSVIG